MFEHVLVALDFSPAAEAMLRCLPGLRELGARKLTLVHIAEVDYPVFGAVASLGHHRKRLEGMASSLATKGFEVQAIAAAGLPAREILKTAAERTASLVLIGSRSHSRVREAFVGSVAWDVVQRAHLPVLLQRLEPASGQPDGPLVGSCCDMRSHVLFATDFSEVAERAFMLVESLARLGVRSFTLMYVQEEKAQTGGTVGESGTEQLNALAGKLRVAGAEAVTVERPTGDPAREILRRANQDQNTMIVMGSQGRGLVAEAVLGSVSREVLRRAPGSVLLAPART